MELLYDPKLWLLLITAAMGVVSATLNFKKKDGALKVTVLIPIGLILSACAIGTYNLVSDLGAAAVRETKNRLEREELLSGVELQKRTLRELGKYNFPMAGAKIRVVLSIDHDDQSLSDIDAFIQGRESLQVKTFEEELQRFAGSSFKVEYVRGSQMKLLSIDVLNYPRLNYLKDVFNLALTPPFTEGTTDEFDFEKTHYPLSIDLSSSKVFTKSLRYDRKTKKYVLSLTFENLQIETDGTINSLVDLEKYYGVIGWLRFHSVGNYLALKKFLISEVSFVSVSGYVVRGEVSNRLTPIGVLRDYSDYAGIIRFPKVSGQH